MNIIQPYHDTMIKFGRVISSWVPKNSLVIFAIMTTLVVYSPVFESEYLFHDDWMYPEVASYFCSVATPIGTFWQEGRPLGGYITCGLFGLFSGIRDLRYSRLIVVIAILVLLFVIYRFLRGERIGRNFAAFIAFGICMLPGCLIMGFWLGAGFIVFALLAAAIAGLLTQYAIRRSGPRKLIALLAAVGCATAGCLIYQIGAMFFWCFAVLTTTVVFAADPRPMLRHAAHYLAVGGCSIIIYSIWYYLSGYFYILHLNDPVRGKIFTNVSDAVIWFVTIALPRALYLWSVISEGWVIPSLAGIIFCSFLFAFLTYKLRKNPDVRTVFRAGSAIYYIFIIVALALVSLGPVLVTNFRLPVYRVLVPLSALIFSITVTHIYLMLPRTIARRMDAPLALAAVVIALWAHGALLQDMVIIAHSEYEMYRQAVFKSAQSTPPAPIHVVLPRMTEVDKTDEVKQLSSEFPQDIPLIIKDISREYAVPNVKSTTSVAGEAFDPTGQVVIDLTPLAQANIATAQRLPPPIDPVDDLISVREEQPVQSCEGNIEMLNGTPPNADENLVSGALHLAGWTTISGKNAVVPDAVYIRIAAPGGNVTYVKARSLPRPDLDNFFKRKVPDAGFVAAISTAQFDGTYSVGIDRLYQGRLEHCQQLKIPVTIRR